MKSISICNLKLPLKIDGNIITDNDEKFIIEVVSLSKTGEECREVAKKIHKLLNDTAEKDSKITINKFE